LTHTVIEFKEENQSVAFNKNILGNYSAESFFGNFNAHQSPFPVNSVISQIENFSRTDTSKCVSVVDELVDKPVNKPLFWSLHFDGSKSNDGAGAGCILVSLEGEKNDVIMYIRIWVYQ